MINDLNLEDLAKKFEGTLDPNLLVEETDADDDSGGKAGDSHQHHHNAF
jgi:hypothetical protein